MSPIVIRSEEELATTIAAILGGIRTGIETGNAGTAFAQLPESVDLDVVFLVAANVGVITQQTIEPETTQTQTQTTPERTVASTNTQTTTTDETATPSGQTVTRVNSGQNEAETTRDYEEVT